MRQFRRIALSCVMLSAVPAHAADPSVPADNVAAVDRAAARGRMLYAYDQAAQRGSSEAMAKLPNARTVVGGWIVEGPADAVRVTFYTKDNPARAAYSLGYTNGRLVPGHVTTGAEATLNPQQLARIAAMRTAREAFVKAGVPTCGNRPFNTVVLPSPSRGFLVYFLTPQPAVDAFPLGGHYLVEIDARGIAGPVHRFANACLAMSAKSPQGAKAQAMVVNDLLNPAPTEIHVFTMYAARLPMVVATAPTKRTWMLDTVDGQPRIRMVQIRAGK